MSSGIEVQDGVAKLLGAYQAVLGVNLETELRAVLETRIWYREDLALPELFRLWICDNLDVEQDPEWVFELLRPNERRHLFDALGIPRDAIVGKTARQWANSVFRACLLPAESVHGVHTAMNEWQHIKTLIANEEDERAAVLSRQRAERVLKQLLFFHCATSNITSFLDVLTDPGSLRVPTPLRECLEADSASIAERVRTTLTHEGLMDLGFLVLALRKFSVRLEEASAKTPLGGPLRLFEQREADAFTSLATALQPYHHDKPSKVQIRRDDFMAAAESVQQAVADMASRRVLPDSLLVTESSCCTNFGRVFRGITDTRRIRCLRSDHPPLLGATIIYVAAAERDYASCFWVASPWAAVA